MKICLLADTNSQNFHGANLREKTENLLNTLNFEIKTIVLDGREIFPCLGCFKCWLTTPGLCIITKDEVNNIAKQVINSDALVFLSQISYGGYSYDTKAFLDRFIPNISPFFEIVQGETHHKKRYKKYPMMISIGYGSPNQQENLTFKKLAQRNALNFRSPHFAVMTVEDSSDFETVVRAFLLNAGIIKETNQYE